MGTSAPHNESRRGHLPTDSSKMSQLGKCPRVTHSGVPSDLSEMSQTDDVPHGLIIPRLIKDESDGKMSPETHYGAPSDLSETSQM